MSARGAEATAWRVLRAAVILAAAILLTLGVREAAERRVSEARAAAALPVRSEDGGFVSSGSCRPCHPAAYATWHRTFHRTMTQPATITSVLAPFTGETLSAHGISYSFRRDADRFWVDVASDAAGGEPRIERRAVVMTTGSHHQQRFWLRGSAPGVLDLLPAAWLVADRRWVPGEAIFLTPPSAVHRLRRAEWNTNCLSCHATAGRPGVGEADEPPRTSVAELGIACEACHGPGAEHVRANRSPLRRFLIRSAGNGDPTIVNPRRLHGRLSSDVCGQCHAVQAFRDESRWLRDGSTYRPGERLDEDRRAIRRTTLGENSREASRLERSYWRDGSVRVSGREYDGLVESPCYQRGELSCLSCHSMHGADPVDQIASGREADGACASCHARIAAEGEQHTHHAPASEGSRCMNCHMPYTTFGLLKAIRSHRIDSPGVERELETGRPNACNLCHLDRTLAWTGHWLGAWYGMAESDPGDERRAIASGPWWLLRGDAGVRALSAWSAGWEPALLASGRGWLVPLLAELLDDPYAAVRYNAVRGLRAAGVPDHLLDAFAPTEQRRRARSEVLALWRRERAPGAERRGAEVLLDADGNPSAAVAALLARRDDRPVTLAE